MSQSEFDARVDRLERRYAGRYGALARRMLLVVFVGYAGFLLWVGAIASLGVLCLAVALVAGEGSVILVIVGACLLGVAIWQAAEVLWLPPDKEDLTPLRKADAPEFYALLERCRRVLRMPRIAHVAVIPDINACVIQRSRLGILGWSQNSMRIGLPLMDLLTPDEFESVVAHECAHLSKRHGRFGAWIYRTRGTWELLFARFQERQASSFSRWLQRALAWFVRWYWPRFHAYFFVMCRFHERQADRCAADWSGAAVTARSLWKISQFSQRADHRFWPEAWRAANVEAEPPGDITARLLAYFATPADPADIARWSHHAVAAVTDSADTHPCLSERIGSFGGSLDGFQSEGMPKLPAESAAQALLGSQLPAVRGAVDEYWRREAAPQWRAQHTRATALQRRARDGEELSNTARTDGRVGRLWEQVRNTLTLEGAAAAEPALRQLLEIRPTHAAANLTLGRHWLDHGNNEGEALLQRVVDQPENDLALEACQALARHYQATGQLPKLREANAWLGQYHSMREEAAQERSTVTARDLFLPAELEPPAMETLQLLLNKERNLAEAYLVRKALKHAALQPLLVLCVRSRPGVFGRSNPMLDMELAGRLVRQVALPGRTLVISPQGSFKRLARKIMNTSGARIFPSAAARPLATSTESNLAHGES